MYKGKVGHWVSIISVVLVIQFCISVVFPWVGSWFDNQEVTFSANCEIDPGFFEVLGDSELDDYFFKVDLHNPDFFFSDTSDSVVKTGYTKYSDYLYSPLVLFTRYAVVNNSDGFIRIDPKQDSHSPLQIDLYDILIAMENGKEWKDIGVSTKVIKGPVNLVIPNERSPYYSAVVDLFYMTLNNLNIPNEEEYKDLTPRVENLLDKCEKIADVSQGIISEYSKHSVDFKVFIAPEYLYRRGGEEMGREYTDQYGPVYFMKTIFIKMDMYVNENKSIVEETKAVQNALQFMLNEKAFYVKTGWRLKDSYLNMSQVSYYLPNTVIGY